MLDMIFLSGVAMAQGTAAKGPSTFEMLIMPIGFLIIMYFLIIRPQQKKAKDQANLVQSLKTGEEVVTSGGLIGRIKSVADTFVTVELAPNANVKVLKSHIASYTKPKEPVVAVPQKAK